MNSPWYNPESPAFMHGEVWVSSTGGRVIVLNVRKYLTEGNHISDWEVTYFTGGGLSTHKKDCWNFQVRYNHEADLV